MRKLLNRTKARTRDDYGKHPNDFEHRCCFREQIKDIAEGTEYGTGETVLVKMQSGKLAEYKLFAERYNYTFEDTGQKNWRYHFVRYV
jgi:hypothetical protein